MNELLCLWFGGVVALVWMDALQTMLEVKYERPFHYRFTFLVWPLFPLAFAVVLAERHYERKKLREEHVKKDSEYEFPVEIGMVQGPAPEKEKCKCGLVAGCSAEGQFYYCLVCGVRWTNER